jgi:hypothetical protein
MAVTTITPVPLVSGTVSDDLLIAGGTAINASNSMIFAYPTEGDLIVQLNNTFAGAKNFTFAAGFGIAKDLGTLVIAMAQDDVRFIVLPSDRYKNSDGNLSLTFESSTTGFVQAFYTPK